MDKGKIGILIREATPVQSLQAIERAEELGVPSVWLNTGGPGPDALTLFAAAAVRTKKIKLGTAIVPTFPRHPLVTVQQAQVVANLAPNRLLLGVGISHAPEMAGAFGLAYERPLQHLREYVTVLKSGLQQGAVNFEGVRFKVHAQVPHPAPVPVLISALRANAFRVGGELADGVLPAGCPAAYLRDVAQPALREGAATANRAVPPLIPAVPVVLTSNADQAIALGREAFRFYLSLPFYVKMFIEAGFPEARDGKLSDRAVAGLVISGDDASVIKKLQDFADISGADGLVCLFVPTGPDVAAYRERAMRLVASLGNS